jgi:Ser/Thr protein kinase RdoA (MazF antagonist)
MSDDVERALALWGLAAMPVRFIAGRENRVYRVSTPQGDFALRLKRPGYRSDAELLAELQWLEAMYAAGVKVPRPQPALSGSLLETIGAQRVDMIGWLPGTPLGRSRAPLALADAPRVFRKLGAAMADLHEACDSWIKPAGFQRCAWDIEGLLGDAPLWGAFWKNPTLDAETRTLFETFRDFARKDLDRLAEGLDYGLIHADLVRENVLVDGQQLRMIDFDDGGWGFRLFDVATALFKNRQEPGYDRLKTALLAGYRSRRALDTTALDLFVVLRAVSYVGWIVPRIDEDGSGDRNLRYIEDARDLCSDYLRQTHPA